MDMNKWTTQVSRKRERQEKNKEQGEIEGCWGLARWKDSDRKTVAERDVYMSLKMNDGCLTD